MASELTLFRQEAVDFQRDARQWGNVVLLEPLSTKVLAWSLTAAAAVIVAFLCLAQYARKETVTGYLTPASGTTKVYAPQQGTIRAVHVKEGELVRKGQPLLTIDTAQIAVDGRDVNTSILTTLNQQKFLLLRQIAAEELRSRSERERLQALIRGSETEIAQLQAQIGLQAERIKLVRSFVTSAAQLNSKGYIADVEYKRRQQDALEQEQTLNALNQQLAARQNQLIETRYALEQLPTTMADKIQLLRNELASTEQRIAEADHRRAYVLVAPSEGRVSMLRAMSGQLADPRHLQLEIIPNGMELRAELFIPTRAAGLVEIGQKVRFLYEAFPYQRYGAYSGRIVSISETIVTGSDISAPVQLKEPAYKAIALLDRPDVDADGKRIMLQPDMLLTADVILEKRSIMAWLTKPLIGTKRIVEMEELEASLGQRVTAPIRQALDLALAYVQEFAAFMRRPDPLRRQHSPDTYRHAEPIER
jgi:membrane fusion protein